MRVLAVFALLVAMASAARANECPPALERPYFVPHPPSPAFGSPIVRDLVADDGVLRIDADLPPQTVYLRIIWGDADLWLRPNQREVCIPDRIAAGGKASVMAVNFAGDATEPLEHRVRIVSLHRGLGWGLISILVSSPLAAALALILWWSIRRHRRGMPKPKEPIPTATLVP